MGDAETPAGRTVDLDTVGDALAVTIEDAARRGERLVIHRGGVSLAVVEPDPRLSEPIGQMTRGDALALLDRMRQGFLDQSEEDIARATAKALAEARAELRAERDARAKAS